ncbi:monovalent cation/H(+) antiporter subunit G [Streptomyces sp. NPDC003077]|uniref:monovalent cation/H(+) antiporter subunit G n=1 Tax=Streptomyces sp. NPDC003077 TaxID=3154443 RepID=UPI0033BE4FFB
MTPWTRLADGLGIAFLLSGALLCLVGAIGMLRLPNVLSRLHAATKPQALGLLLILAGGMLRLRNLNDLGTLVLVGLFQLLTAPVASHMVGRAAYRTGQADSDDLAEDELAQHLREENDGQSPNR